LPTPKSADWEDSFDIVDWGSKENLKNMAEAFNLVLTDDGESLDMRFKVNKDFVEKLKEEGGEK